MAEQTVKKRGPWAWFKNQFDLGPLIKEYLIPNETNNFWYSLGGILAIALVLQIITGILLAFKYIPDAALAYGIISGMLHSQFWKIIVGFHYFNSFLIVVLVLAHLMRVFVSAAYRNGKKGLWLIGVALYAMILLLYITGEALHWDEVGFAVAWHISEFYQATHLNNVLHYNFSDLLSPASATPKLIELYALHIAIVPLVILLFIFLHFYLVRIKGISLPFWKTPSGQKSPFIKHVKLWLIFGSFMIAAVLLLTIFVGRETGTAPQLLPTSPLYLAKHGPGALGFKPSWPIGWTHGMNLFVEKLGLNPDIWGTVIAGMLMFVSLLLVPFVDRVEKEPENAKGVFNWKRRIWAFLAIALFWGVMITGIIINGVAGPG